MYLYNNSGATIAFNNDVFLHIFKCLSPMHDKPVFAILNHNLKNVSDIWSRYIYILVFIIYISHIGFLSQTTLQLYSVLMVFY